MPGKLPIRRVGAILPALCLVGILLCTALTVWLSCIGLPDGVLRRAEAIAAEQGVQLKLGSIRLAPASGLALKLDDVHLSMPQEGAAPLTLETRRILVEFDFGKLMNGHYLPECVSMPEGNLRFPLEEEGQGTPLCLDHANARAEWTDDDQELRLSLRTKLNGIMLAGGVRLTMPELTLPPAVEATNEEAEQASPLAAVEEIRPILRRVRDDIERQHWTEAEAPLLVLLADLTGDTPHIIAKANVPRWEQEPFRYLDIKLDSVFRNNILIVNQSSFRTEDPDAVVTLQGGYDLTKREADFRLTSNAAVINMVQKLVAEEDIPELLKRLDIKPEHAPRIELAGHITLTGNDEIENIRLEGDIHQDGLLFGRTEVTQTDLSFYFDNGNLNIDKLQFRLPEGGLFATALLRDGKGQADIKTAIPTPVLMQLAQDTELLTAEECAELGLSGMNTLALTADFTVPVFVPGKTTFEEFVPTLRGLKAHLELERVTQEGLTLFGPWLDVALEGAEHDTEQAQAARLTLSLTLPRTEYWQGEMSSEEREGALTLTVNNLHVDGDSFRAQAAELTASLKSHAASFGEQHASADGMALSAQLGALNIPFSGDAAPTLSSGKAEFSCESSAMEEQKLTGLKVTLTDLRNLVLSGERQDLPQSGTLHLTLATLDSGDKIHAADTEATLSLHEGGAAQLALSGYLNDKPWETHATARLHEDGNTLLLDEAHLALPAAELEPLLAAAGLTIDEVKIPKELELTLRSAELALAPFELKHALAALRIPALTRCPQLPVLKGQDITIGVDTVLDLRPDAEGNILYTGTARVTHETGELNAELEGNLSSHVRVRGDNTIHADVIDRLIDDPDAHYIMRDFIFTRGVTKIHASNIDTLVDYSNGITVVSHCDAELHNMDYMLMSMEDTEDAEGNVIREKIRTDLGTDFPYSRVTRGTCGVDVEVRMNRKDAQGNPIKDVILVDLTNAELLYDNRPWFKRQGITGGKAETVLRGKRVRLDIENSVVLLDDIEGECYPAYAIGMFYPDLQIFMKDVRLTRPAQAATAHCAFPMASDCTTPMGGTIRALCSTGATFDFLGTRIPLEKFSGFVTISDEDVYLNRMNALTWEGVVNADVRIGFAGGKTSVEGYIQAENLNLHDIAAAYNTKLSPALVTADCRFTCPTLEVDSLRAYGNFAVQDGNLLELKIFDPVGELISDLPNYLIKFESAVSPRGENYRPNWVLRQLGKLFSATGNTVDSAGGHITGTAEAVPFANHLLSYDIQDAHGTYYIDRSHFITENAKVRGNNLNVRLNLDLGLEKLDLHGNLWPTISGVPTVLLSPLTFVSDYMIDVIIYGTLSDIKWHFALDRALRKEKTDEFKPSAESEERPHE